MGAADTAAQVLTDAWAAWPAGAAAASTAADLACECGQQVWLPRQAFDGTGAPSAQLLGQVAALVTHHTEEHPSTALWVTYAVPLLGGAR